MRELKFRGRPYTNDAWIHFTLGSFLKANTPSPVLINPATVQQFTGLCDKHRQEIYDGDILRVGMRRGDSNGWTKEQVAWNDRAGEWGLVRNGEFMQMQMQRDPKLRELIGNIYENPDLLKTNGPSLSA